MPVIRASVESAIMSLLALESHSSVSSCSDVCFTSTAPMTCNPLRWHAKRLTNRTTHPHRPDTVLVEPLLDRAVHALQVPADEVPADAKRDLLALGHHTRRQSNEVSQVSRI